MSLFGRENLVVYYQEMKHKLMNLSILFIAVNSNSKPDLPYRYTRVITPKRVMTGGSISSA